jgi:hypothetical protein
MPGFPRYGHICIFIRPQGSVETLASLGILRRALWSFKSHRNRLNSVNIIVPHMRKGNFKLVNMHRAAVLAHLASVFSTLLSRPFEGAWGDWGYWEKTNTTVYMRLYISPLRHPQTVLAELLQSLCFMVNTMIMHFNGAWLSCIAKSIILYQNDLCQKY